MQGVDLLLGEKKTRRERGRESIERNSNLSLQSTELGCLVFIRPRTKVHLRDESYVWVLETKDFIKDSSKEFGRLWVSGLLKALSPLQEVGILPTLIYFPF